VATEIGGDIRHGNFEPFVNAHSLSRGAGYMAGRLPRRLPNRRHKLRNSADSYGNEVHGRHREFG
jgi:hypothetical protein